MVLFLPQPYVLFSVYCFHIWAGSMQCILMRVIIYAFYCKPTSYRFILQTKHTFTMYSTELRIIRSKKGFSNIRRLVSLSDIAKYIIRQPFEIVTMFTFENEMVIL